MAFKYVVRNSKTAKSKPGKSIVAKGKKPALGSGGRFAALKKGLAAKGATNPGALAAYIGRKKYGAKKFASLSAKGRKK